MRKIWIYTIVLTILFVVNGCGDANISVIKNKGDGNSTTTIPKPSPTTKPNDNIVPTITLNGASTINLVLNTTYNELGAVATDNIDVDISENIVKVGTVDTSKAGTYTITYDVSDKVGNKAIQITRTVIVKDVVISDNIVPTITLNGASTINLVLNATYNELGAVATDNVDGDISANIVKVGTVDTSKAGTYTITYDVSDSVGNNAIQVSRNIVVTLDKISPIISLNGTTIINIAIGEKYIEKATASDNIDGNITSNIIKVGSVDTTTLGTYTITYDVSDSSGNKATQITRTVIVTPKPTITLNGASIIYQPLNTTYVELGATATDSVDGNLTSSIITSGTVDTALKGSYTITYKVTNSSSNDRNVTRLVIVRDYKVTKTGQTTTYTTFDDGYYQKGSTKTYTRDDVKQIVTDNYTGLMWQDDANVSIVTKPWVTTANYNAVDYNNTSGDTATTYCTNLTLGGYSDWRLPTHSQLREIVDYGKSNPSIDTAFVNIYFDMYYYSSTPYILSSNNAWIVGFYNGTATNGNKAGSYVVRCVRGQEKSLPNTSFTRSNVGIVTDSLTKLQWQDDTIGTIINWTRAISRCEALTLGGFSDWRLPNIKELQSIVDDSKISPSIDSAFVNTVSDSYWSSTTLSYDSSFAWYVTFATGNTYNYLKTYPRYGYYVRCVRAGQ